MDVLGSSIELLLHALIANAAEEPACLEAAKDILENGENLNVTGYQDQRGNSLLHVACWHGQQDIAELLIDDFQMPLDAKNRDGQSPLIAAVSNHAVTDGSNVRLACSLALKMGDVRSLFDAVEGASQSGIVDVQSDPMASRCLGLLANKLQQQLASDDESALQEAVELARGVAKGSPLSKVGGS